MSLLIVHFSGCSRPPGEIFSPLGSGQVWPPPPAQARIRYLGAFAGGADLKPGQSGGEALMSVLRGPSATFPIGSPHGVAVSGDRVLVTSPSTATVHVLNLQTREHLRIWQTPDGPLRSPIGVAEVGEEMLVTDSVLGCVLRFGPDGAYRSRFGESELERPAGIIHVPSNESLYVLDSGNDQCVIFDRQGQALSRFGSSGTGPGQFNRPAHLTFAPPDRLWIVDTLNTRVQSFDLQGRFVSEFGKRGDGGGDFSLPKGVAIDQDGHVYVVDAHYENVQIFDEAGRLLMAFGGPGRGAHHLSLPSGLAIDSANRVWVADTYNHRLAVYEYLPDVMPSRPPIETAVIVEENDDRC